MYYVTFGVGVVDTDTYCEYTTCVRAMSARHAIGLVCRGKRRLVSVSLSPIGDSISHLARFA